jgi:hypothetical protein
MCTPASSASAVKCRCGVHLPARQYDYEVADMATWLRKWTGTCVDKTSVMVRGSEQSTTRREANVGGPYTSISFRIVVEL